ncbi:TolB family protein [Agaribacter flavus]|uniref:TolB family protein n=1 Tax=Agaribacter flavus TaxID=1902781 RepID=A0ABV7FPC6_9ALTE
MTTKIKPLLLLTSFVFTSVGFAQTPPASDIYVGELTRDDKGLRVVNLERLTHTDSYTNQPYFFDDFTLYYTEQVGQQTDIFRYDFQSKETSNLTQSTDSEYSATPMPNGDGFSVVKVDQEGKQELWQFSFAGDKIKHLAPSIEPVGYHLWTRDDKVFLFVLGEPNRLLLIDPSDTDGTASEIDNNIGASLYAMPNTRGYTYTTSRSGNDDTLILRWYSALSNERQVLTKLPKGAKYFTWTPSAELLTTDKGALVAMPFLVQGKRIESTVYSKVLIEGEACQRSVSRIAVSPYNEKIALVCEAAPQHKEGL